MQIKHSLFRGLTFGFSILGIILLVLAAIVQSSSTKNILRISGVLSLLVFFIVSGVWKYQTFLLASRYDIRNLEDERDIAMAEYIKYIYWGEIMWNISIVLFTGAILYFVGKSKK